MLFTDYIALCWQPMSEEPGTSPLFSQEPHNSLAVERTLTQPLGESLSPQGTFYLLADSLNSSVGSSPILGMHTDREEIY